MPRLLSDAAGALAGLLIVLAALAPCASGRMATPYAAAAMLA